MIVVLLGLMLASPEARLDEIRRDFALAPKARSVAALEALAADAPGSDVAGRALAWIGDLQQQAGDHAAAKAAYERALPIPGEPHRLAARGLGDLALKEGRFAEARGRFEDAARGATGVLGIELAQKEALAGTLLHRRWAAWGAGAVLVLAIAWLVVRIRRGQGALRVPVELWYVVPVYALLIAGAVGRDAGVVRALVWCAPGSMGLIALSGVAARRAPARPVVQAVVVVAANLALFYLVLYGAGLLETLGTTVEAAVG